MFQLIVAVISIVLVAALAIASIYYGGEAFNKSSLRASVTTLVNGGQQIAGAQALYRTDNGGTSAVDFASLRGTGDREYLASIPGISKVAIGAWTLSADGKVAIVDLQGNVAAVTAACAEVANQANGGSFYADDEAFREGTAQFGCVGTTAAAEFAFKL